MCKTPQSHHSPKILPSRYWHTHEKILPKGDDCWLRQCLNPLALHRQQMLLGGPDALAKKEVAD